MQVVFKTVTYHGDSGRSGGDGADGMNFFLLDGGYPIYDVGAFGGSLGYTCSNTNNDPNLHPDGTPRAYDGVQHGYLGLGMDEFGNYLNQSDNTAAGFGFQPGRIGLRGAGNISWGQLNALNSSYYPSSLSASQRAAAVQNTCETGYLWNYSRASSPRETSTAVADYAPIYASSGVGAYSVLTAFKIANEGAMTRGAATPLTYSLKITQNGLLSLSYSYNGGNYIPIISKQEHHELQRGGAGQLPLRIHGLDGRRHQHSRDPMLPGHAGRPVKLVGRRQREGSDQDLERYSSLSRLLLSEQLDRPADCQQSLVHRVNANDQHRSRRELGCLLQFDGNCVRGGECLPKHRGPWAGGCAGTHEPYDVDLE